MKTYIKLQGRVGNYKQHSEKFATASIQISEKDQKGNWINIYVQLKIFNPTEPIHENVDYTIVGSLGVSPAYKQYPEKIVINVKSVELAVKGHSTSNGLNNPSENQKKAYAKEEGYVDPVAKLNPASQNIPM